MTDAPATTTTVQTDGGQAGTTSHSGAKYSDTKLALSGCPAGSTLGLEGTDRGTADGLPTRGATPTGDHLPSSPSAGPQAVPS